MEDGGEEGGEGGRWGDGWRDGMLGSRAFPCHPRSRTRFNVAREGVYARVCPVCLEEWCVSLLPMLTAKGLKIGWLKREEHLRILRAVRNQDEMESLEKEFGRLKAELSSEIARVAAVKESELEPDIDGEMTRRIAGRPTVKHERAAQKQAAQRSVKPVGIGSRKIDVEKWGTDSTFDAEERDLNQIMAMRKIAKDQGV